MARSTPESKPKTNLGQQLLQKRILFTTLQKDFATQAAARKNLLDDNLKAALASRRNAIAELEKAASVKKEEFKRSYDLVVSSIRMAYEAEVAAVTKKRDDGLEATRKVREEGYSRVNAESDSLAAPHIEKHRAAMKSLQKKYEQEEARRKVEDEKALNDLKGDIKDLEEELEAQRKRFEEAAAGRSQP